MRGSVLTVLAFLVLVPMVWPADDPPPGKEKKIEKQPDISVPTEKELADQRIVFMKSALNHFSIRVGDRKEESKVGDPCLRWTNSVGEGSTAQGIVAVYAHNKGRPDAVAKFFAIGARHLVTEFAIIAEKDVAIISQSLARRLFGGTNPIGRRVRRPPFNQTVVGVVADVRYNSTREPSPGIFYTPGPWGYTTLMVRTRAPAAGADSRTDLPRLPPRRWPRRDAKLSRGNLVSQLLCVRVQGYFAQVHGRIAPRLSTSRRRRGFHARWWVRHDLSRAGA